MTEKIMTSAKKWLLVGSQLATFSQGGLCTLPLMVGTLFKTTPQSPLYFDNGATFRSISVDNPGGRISVAFWRSMTQLPPANAQAITDAITAGTAIPQPDMSNHKWIPLTDVNYGIPFDIGLSEIPQAIIDAARQSRWLKIDPLFGSFLNTNFWPQGAGQ